MRHYYLLLSRATVASAVALMIVANMALPAHADDAVGYDPDYDGYSMGLYCNEGAPCGSSPPAGQTAVVCSGFCFIGTCSRASTPAAPVLTTQCCC